MSEEQLWVLGILFFLVVFILGSRIYSFYQLKQKVKKRWGKESYHRGHDNEESLLLAYETMKQYHTSTSEVDEITWHDLDLFSVFKQFNHTYSSIGSEALYRRMRQFDFDPKKQEKMEQLIAFLDQNPSTREDIEFAFAQLGKKDKNYVVDYLVNGQGKRLNSLWRYVLLGILPFFFLALFFAGWTTAIFLFLCSIIYNIVYYQSKKITLDTELTSMGYLIQTIATAKKISKIDHPLQKAVKESVHPLQSTLKFAFSFRMKSGSETEIFFDYLNMIVMLPFIAYHFVLNRLSTYNDEAFQLWQTLGQLEMACAILNYRTYSDQYCLPVFQEGGVHGENIAHPLVEEPVLNPVKWTQNTLVTGSNASGKSTYVKAVAINCILAQTFYTCTAETFTLEPGHVLTSMAVQDDIFAGDSYFIAEIKSLKRVLEKVKSKERCYLFIDEILKGTNTIERIAASSTIVHWLRNYPSLAFVATHDIELTNILEKECANLHFQEQVSKENGVYFDYLLREGPATSRNALRLLDVMNYPETMVAQAEELAAAFDQTEQWKTLN